MEVYVAVALIGGLVAGAIASGRGKSFGGFFILGALLPLIGIVVALLQPADQSKLSQLTPAATDGWHRDPTGRFEQRYYDGKTWTRHVARSGEQFEDPL